MRWLLLATVIPAAALAAGMDSDAELPDGDFVAARALMAEGDFAAALPPLTAASANMPTNADVFNLLGYAYRNLGRLDESAVAYERALALDPDHLGALEYQGELFILLDDVESAKRNAARLVTLCPAGCAELHDLTGDIAEWAAENLN